MKSAAGNRRSFLARSFPMIALLAIGVMGTFGALVALGAIELPWMKKPVPINRAGQVAVPVSSGVIPAYTQIVREHFFDLQKQEPTVVWLRQEQLKPEMLVDISKIVGRVLRKEKGKGYAFTENDFLPEKTRPGLVAGIPPGMRALAIDADKVRGIHALRAGDHFDLLATATVDDGKALSKAIVVGGGAGGKRAVVRPLVQNGVVVLAAALWKPPTDDKDKKGAARGKEPSPEIVIAAKPDEVVALSQALAMKDDLIAIARSGRPDDPGDSSITPGSPPPPPKKAMEAILGGQRKTLVFPNPLDGPLTLQGPRGEEPPSDPPIGLKGSEAK